VADKFWFVGNVVFGIKIMRSGIGRMVYPLFPWEDWAVGEEDDVTLLAILDASVSE
jgi:hypothetical protein